MNEYKIGDKVEIISIGVFNKGFVKVGDIATFMDEYTLSCPTWKDTQVIYKRCIPVHIKPWVEPKAATSKLKFPCCVSTSEIKDAKTLLALVALFEANGAYVYDGVDCGGKLDPLLRVELQTGVSMVSSLVYEDLEYLLIKGQLYE